MVRIHLHGHKTEERRHVLNNKKFIKLNAKAWSGNILCLSTIVCLGIVSVPAPSFSQSNDVLNRINRLENELDTLNRAVYKGERAPTPIYNQDTSNNSNSSGAVEIRIQQLEGQLRSLTGRIEEQGYAVEQMQQRLNTMTVQMLEQKAAAEKKPENPMAIEIKPPEIQGMKTILPKGSNSTTLYEHSFAALKAENFTEAQEGFEKFVAEYPENDLTPNAKYWLGETHYVQGKFDKAAKAFAQGFQKYPKSTKAPDNLLKLGLSLAGMGKVKEACVALSQVKVKFPKAVGNIDRSEKERSKLNCKS